MEEYDLLVVLPIVITIGNVILVLLLAARSKELWRKLAWLGTVFVLTCVVWFLAAMPYIIGLADSYASCAGQLGYPGCQQFEQLTTLFDQTLGNFRLLLVFDLIILTTNWYFTLFRVSHRQSG